MPRYLSAITIIAFTLLLAPWSASSQPYGSGPTVRIGLVRLYPHLTELTLIVQAGARVDTGSQTSAKGPGEWKVTAADGKVTISDGEGKRLASGARLRVEPGEEGDPIGLGTQAGRISRHYRGVIELTADPESGKRGAQALLIVNEAPLETYLRGVIAREMPPSAPAEALRAQAIVARTYALKCRGRYRTQGYDLTDTTASQIYDGVEAERPATDAAVSDTAGMVITRNRELILTDYYDDCGGITAPGYDADDYPPSVRDAPEDGGADYCAHGTYHTWDLTVTAEELARRAAPRIGKVADLTVIEQDESGRAQKVRITGEKGSVEVTGAKLRAMLGYDRLKSTLFAVERQEDGSFIFHGKGYGHGHGLCQSGAMGMAGAPYRLSYREILAHYFPASAVVAFDERLASNGAR